MYKRNRAPRISLASLLITFLLGAVIGGATVYGVMGGSPDDTQVANALTTDPAPPDSAEPAPAERERPPENGASVTPDDLLSDLETGTPSDPIPAPMPDPFAADLPEGPLRGARFLFISTSGVRLNADTRAFLGDFQPGGVVLLGHNIENRDQTIAYVEAIKDATGMGADRADLPLIAVDQEGGTVNRLRLWEAPSAAEIGATGDRAFAAEVAANFAQACRARGIAVNFAPVLDIRDPGGPALFERRTFSDDGVLVAELGLEFARTLMDGGVLPVAKHYPGHGAASADSHDHPAILDHSLEELAHIMYPFAEAVAHGVPGIMTGHITVTQLDPAAPATLSSRLLQQVLRESWGYDGVIISDDLAMRAITGPYSLEEAAVRALQAGCDALIITESNFDTLRRVAHAIEVAVEEGELDEERLRHSQRRLDGWQAWLRSADEALDEVLPEPEEVEDTPLEEITDVAAEDDADDDAEPADDEGAGDEVSTKDADAEIDDAEADEVDSVETDPAEGLTAIRHEVQQGEWLSRIAAQYGVTTRQLVEWNNLPSDDVRFGTLITVYLPPARAAAFTNGATPEIAPDADAEAPKDTSPEDTAPEDNPTDESAPAAPEAAGSVDPAAQPPGTRAIIHDVMPGETLTRLAQRYRVGTSNIIAWNDLANTNIRIGDQLTIYVPEDAEFAE